MNPFGYPDVEWNSAKEQAKAAMIAAVRGNRGTIFYSELVSKISAIMFEAHDKRLDALLEDVSRDENAAGRGMLSVVVVHKSGDMQPGPGFFKLAKSLGRNADDALRFWSEEFERVRANWKTS